MRVRGVARRELSGGGRVGLPGRWGACREVLSTTPPRQAAGLRRLVECAYGAMTRAETLIGRR